MTIRLLYHEQLTEHIQKQIEDLYSQLNATAKQRNLQEILGSTNNVFMAVCYSDEQICGMALMATYKVISGHRGMIEDVVVDSIHRGQGIGRKLMQKLLAVSKEQNLDEVLLFSGHHREAAISLYKSLGFNLRNSGVYTLRLT